MTRLAHVGNKIFDRLPRFDLERIIAQMERLSPDVGEVVALPDKEPRFVHFPISGVLSSMVVLEDGSMIEASTIGNEGMDGLYLLANPLANPYPVNVQVQGDMLGVRRQSVNLTARVLQQANLIKYHRGELTILHREGLEEASCECFRVTSQMYERMMTLGNEADHK